MSILSSIPIFAMGIGLIYFGYLEINALFLFIYLTLGLAMVVIGIQLFLSGIRYGDLKFRKKSDMNKLEKSTIEHTKTSDEARKGEPEKCPNCGEEITTAGKFCGNCGKIL